MTDPVPNERELAFFDALLKRAGQGDMTPEHIAAAVCGFTLREHVRKHHAGQEERCSHAAPPPGEPHREAWLFGYNFGNEQATCQACGETFMTSWTKAEAEAEAEALFGVPNASTNPNMALVCEDCFVKLMSLRAT